MTHISPFSHTCVHILFSRSLFSCPQYVLFKHSSLLCPQTCHYHGAGKCPKLGFTCDLLSGESYNMNLKTSCFYPSPPLYKKIIPASSVHHLPSRRPRHKSSPNNQNLICFKRPTKKVYLGSQFNSTGQILGCVLSKDTVLGLRRIKGLRKGLDLKDPVAPEQGMQIAE